MDKVTEIGEAAAEYVLRYPKESKGAKVSVVEMRQVIFTKLLLLLLDLKCSKLLS